MNRSRRSSWIRVAAAGLLAAAVATAGPAVSSAAASNATACGLMTQRDIAKAFGLRGALDESTALLEPGNPEGVIQVRCRGFAWKENDPRSAPRRRRALLNGNAVTIRIETWVPDPGPHEGVWLASFPAKLEALERRAKAQFLRGSRDGSAFAPPLYGAEGAIGYRANTAKTTKVNAIWWRGRTGELISFTIEEAKGLPIVRSLTTLAARMVPGIAT